MLTYGKGNKLKKIKKNKKLNQAKFGIIRKDLDANKTESVRLLCRVSWVAIVGDCQVDFEECNQ